MQEPEICVEAGMTPDTMVDELGTVLAKYEVPMGLMNKLMMLSEFEYLEFMVDDSGSMYVFVFVCLLCFCMQPPKKHQRRYHSVCYFSFR